MADFAFFGMSASRLMCSIAPANSCLTVLKRFFAAAKSPNPVEVH